VSRAVPSTSTCWVLLKGVKGLKGKDVAVLHAAIKAPAHSGLATRSFLTTATGTFLRRTFVTLGCKDACSKAWMQGAVEASAVGGKCKAACRSEVAESPMERTGPKGAVAIQCLL
jgi:hypothetical protein